MKLISFQVKKFRNILDSQSVSVQRDVTALVGKNESGKTAILSALTRLNPAYDESFSAKEHYPRWLFTSDRSAGRIESTEPVTGVFEIEDEDKEAFTEEFGTGVLAGDQLTYVKLYDGSSFGKVDINEKAMLDNFLTRQNASDEARTILKHVACLMDLRDFDLDIEDTSEDDSLAEELEELSGRARERLGESGTSQSVSVGFLTKRLPKFFYFSDYSTLPGRVDLRELKKSDGKPAVGSTRTARALLALAGTSVEMLAEDDYEERKAELEAVSNELTDQVFDYWSQNESLEVLIDIDKETIPNERSGRGETAVARYLDVRLKDKRHGFTSNFSQRSRGFQWFFSFLAAFSEFEHRDDNVVVLLDEPGLALHAKAQEDFLKFINERLAPTVQVLYTTHSPFMIQPGRLERARVVEDKGPKKGAVVSADVMTVGEDTLFPLQAALGYDIAQNLFVGADNIVVEGLSDYIYLTVLSEYLASQGRQSLDPAWRILPAGGVTNVPAFVSLMGTALDVTVFVDSGSKGLQRLVRLADSGLLKTKRLLTVGDITGSKKADIEDLFSPGDYLKLYNPAFNRDHTVGDLREGDRIVGRIGRTEGEEFTDHGKPADYFLRNSHKLLPTFTEATLNNFEKAIAEINSTREVL